MMLDKNTIVIGVDHGWSQMKTVNAEVFTTGVKEITTEPALYDNVLEYKGKYYKVGGCRLEVKETKVSDDNFYLLTLAAIAKELEYRCKRDAHIFLAVGLPIGRFGAEKKDFIRYLSEQKEVTFKFEKRQYHIVIQKVAVYREENSIELQMVPDELLEAETVAETQMLHQNMKPTIHDATEESDEESAFAGKSLIRFNDEGKVENHEDSISYRMTHMRFTPEQKKEIKRALDMHIPKKYILSYAYPENSVIKMMQYRKDYAKKTEIHL